MMMMMMLMLMLMSGFVCVRACEEEEAMLLSWEPRRRDKFGESLMPERSASSYRRKLPLNSGRPIMIGRDISRLPPKA